MRKAVRVTGIILVFSILFGIMASCSFAILCDDPDRNRQNNGDKEYRQYMDSKGYVIRLRGETRPENDEPYDGARAKK